MRTCIAIFVVAALARPLAAQTDTTFTYQGELKVGGVPTNGAYNLDFTLWDSLAGGTQIDAANMFNALNVTDGLFTVDLDFGGGAFDNAARWLEISVNGFELSPRTPITRTPYAIQTRGINVDANKNVGIGTTNPQHLLHVVGDSDINHAIYGRTTETVSNAAGVYGESSSPNGYGVYGFGNSLIGNNYGVYGITTSSSGRGVYGLAAVGSGTNYGVYGQSQSTGGIAVYANASASTGGTTAIWADCASPSGYAGRFNGRGYFSKAVGIGTYPAAGVQLDVSGPGNGTAICGEGLWGVEGTSTDPNGRGIFGYGASITGTNYGVYGLSASENGRGVYGYNTSTTGASFGVYGESASSTGRGVYGYASDLAGVNHGVHGESDSVFGRGVVGHVTSPTGTTQGVRGTAESPNGIAVVGVNNATTGDAVGVYGQSDSVAGTGVEGRSAGTNATGVFGFASAASGTTFGVVGKSNSADGYAFYADTPGTDYGSASSIRWKRNVVNIDDPLEKLSRLRGVYYDWDETHGGTRDVGMIAEEVGEVLPEIVQYEANGIDAIGMDYSRMTPLLVEAVNALRAEKDTGLAALRAEKDAEMRELRTRITELEQLIERLTTTQTEIRQ